MKMEYPPFSSEKNNLTTSKVVRKRFKFPKFGNLLRIITIMKIFLAFQVNCLIDDPVSQLTSIQSYTTYPNLMFQHAYFDISFNDRGNLVQTDETALYQLSRLSVLSYNYFQFFTTFHANQTTEQTYVDIDLERYKVYGMCQNQGNLDYVVALHQDLHEIQILRLFYDPSSELGIVQDYKVVDKDENLILTGDLYVDCKYNGDYRGVGTYVVGILGSYLEPNSLISYYFAKFSTKYNLTEYFIKSNNPSVMEIPRVVKVDVDNQRIYLGIEINKNKYQGSTVYQPGALPGNDNSNVALIGYDWNYGTRLWVTVVGNEQYMDQIVDIECYGNNVYAVLNSFSTTYSSNSSQTDIYYYKLRSENGYILTKTIFGSPSDDKALDLVITFTGPHLLALINSPFLPHRDTQKEWKTQNGNPNIALILLDFTDQIVDIEAYDITNSTTVNPYPTRFFINRISSSSVKERYTFISHRSNLDVDDHGGIFITYLKNYDAIYGLTTGCSISNCAKCANKVTTQCLECSSGFLLWQSGCYSNTCPWYSYQYYDYNNNAINYCKDCHYSCQTCTGPRDDTCATCCTNGACGSVFDRVPSLGTCNCPVGMKESNGVCSYSCVLNLGATTDNRCYPNCPDNSYPDLQYSLAQAQESTEYNPGATGACALYTQHLRFQQDSKGLRVPGPTNLETMPTEFSIGFWISPLTLNTNSYFVNAFGRIQIFSQVMTKNILYKFITGTSTFVSPTYVSANQVLSLGSWNYVAVSQRQITQNNVLSYEIQLGLSTSNFGTVYSAGYTNSQPVVNYGAFTNMMYIGAYSDSNPQSFTGYLKDLRVFTIFHGLAQMSDDSFRIYRFYSYDDPKLVAYWKFTEGYSSTSIQYTIYDYSLNMNSIQYSLLSDPGYPTFVTDSSQPLSLCYFHDVKTCRTLQYESLPPIATSSAQYMELLLNMQDSLLVQSTGDIMFVVQNNTDCISPTQSGILAQMTYVSSALEWQVISDSLNPIYLPEATHYQLCYYDSSIGGSFNMVQLYVAGRPRTVDPSTGNIYNRTDNQQQWMTGGGDQANGDIIRFSYDCQYPIVNETEMLRSNTPSYLKINILNTFNLTGDFFFCWNPVFMQDFSPTPQYDFIHHLKYKIQYEPQISATFRTLGSVNEDIFQLQISGTFVEGDQFIMTWPGSSYSDCNPINQMGDVYYYNHSQWPSIWIGYGTGIHGVNITDQDTVQACWKPGADMAPDVFIRAKLDDLTPYQMRLINYNTLSNQRAPELQTFNPPYGSAVLTESDRTIQFGFKSQQVIPSSDGNGNLGKLIIYRGAIKEDGTFIKVPTQILWQNLALNESTTPDPLQQGDLICSQTGQCSIILSQDSNRMKAGEIYYLTFYSYSFMTYFGTNKYFLFNTKYPLGTAVYDHLFMCRSYNIYPTDALVNGNTLTINGLDLRSKVIQAKWLGNTIVSDTFYTKAINIRLKVYNTDSYFCINTRPTLTVAMEDVTDTAISIKNLQLRQCNDGNLFADYIEVIRGIRDENGDFTYERSEKMYNVQLGTVGCDNSCLICNGTSSSNCMICSNRNNYLYNGRCYSQCPSNAAFISSYTITYQNLVKTQNTCVVQCQYGNYPDPVTNICTACNTDCLTCNQAVIASCTSCNPNMQLYNGICVDNCPTPHHSNNYTSYVCNQINTTTYLQVKILSLGFINRIPKDKQVYLKADINNTGGGNITGILWTQLSPDVTLLGPVVDIFANNSDPLHSSTSQIVGLNNNALMKMSDTYVVKVQCTVTNSVGEIAYDIYEFYLNESPFVGNITITKVNESSTSLGTSVNTLWRIDLTNWYDSPDETYETLKLKVFVIRNYKIGLNSQNEQLTLTDQTNQTTLFVRMPPFQIDQTLISQQNENNLTVPYSVYQTNITICVQAEDIYYAQSTKCLDFNQVQNRPEFSSNYTYVTQYINQNLSISTNISDLLFATNMIYQSVQVPLRQNQQDGLCTLDIHCSYNGECSSDSGIQKCVCYQSYFGTYCQFQGNQLQNLRTISQQIVDTTLARMNNWASQNITLKPFDLEIIANVVRGLLSSPDLIDDETFQNIVTLLEYVSSANQYSHQPFDSNNTDIMFKAYSSAMIKINHSFKSRRANSDTVLLGAGLGLLQISNYFSLSSNPTDVSTIEEQPYFLSDSQKPYLIGGIDASRQRRLYLQEAVLELYQDWGRRVDRSFLQFLKMVMLKMDPLNNQVLEKQFAFDLMISHAKSSSFIGRTYVKQKDSYWDFPSNIWDQQTGVASKKQEIRQLIIKHVLNPFKFEMDQGAFLESNMTAVEYYSIANNKITVDLTASNTYVDFKDPFNTTMGFQQESLRCMAWSDSNEEFTNDNSCSYSYIWDVIPCSDCDQYNQINTTVSVCRCKHLSRFGVVYQSTNVTQSVIGYSPGIYSDFYAMKYWSESFGYYATIAGLCFFFAGHIFIWFIDERMQHNLIVKLREKIRRFELQYGAKMMRKDGLFFNKEELGIEPGKSTKIASKKKVYLKQNQDDAQSLIGDQDNVSVSKRRLKSKSPSQTYGPEEEIKEKPKRRIKSKKVYEDDQEEPPREEQNSDESFRSIREEDAYTNVFQRNGRRGRQKRQKDHFKVNADFDENDRIIMKHLEEEKRRKLMKRFELEEELEKKRDLSHMSPEQRDQYERHLKIERALIKRDLTAQQLYHKLMEIKHHELEGMTKREFKKRIMVHVKRLPKDLARDVKDFLKEVNGQLNSTDEEMFLNMKELFSEERERREIAMFRLKGMIIHGSFLFSIFFVTSLLSPRHIRWSLFFCNVVMLWFICAVFYNNTKDPLAVPNFSKKASSLVFKDLWISFLAPWGSTLLMYILSSFLKMPNSQLLNVVTLRQLEAALIEYRKEALVRFIMGYIIVCVIMGVIFWYIIQFTATFGWKVAWTWWYAGIMAIILQFAFVDPLFSVANYFLFKFHKKAGRIWLKMRSITQGYNELFYNSDEEKDRKDKEAKKKEIIDPENPQLSAQEEPSNKPNIFVQNLESQHKQKASDAVDEIKFNNLKLGDKNSGNSQGTNGSGGRGGSGEGNRSSKSGGDGDGEALTGHTNEHNDMDMAENSRREPSPAKKKGKKKKKKKKN